MLPEAGMVKHLSTIGEKNVSSGGGLSQGPSSPQDLGVFLTVVPTGTEVITLSLLRVPRA